MPSKGENAALKYIKMQHCHAHIDTHSVILARDLFIACKCIKNMSASGTRNIF